jgi:hypothetical protein
MTAWPLSEQAFSAEDGKNKRHDRKKYAESGFVFDGPAGRGN